MQSEQAILLECSQRVALQTEGDEALAREAKGDPQSFAELYQRYVDRIYRFHLVRTGSSDDAQDLTSQTFMAALESIGTYGGRGSFCGWLFGIARHKVIDHYRRRRSDVPLENVESWHHPDPAPEDLANTHLQLAQVVRALHSLDKQQAEAVTLRIFGELSAREIGQIMGKSEGAVKMLVHRGLRTLQERLAHTLEVSK